MIVYVYLTTGNKVDVEIEGTWIVTGAISYEWELLPLEAGVLNGITNEVTISWDDSWHGNASLRVRGLNGRTAGEWSESLDVLVSRNPDNGHLFCLTNGQ